MDDNSSLLGQLNLARYARMLNYASGNSVSLVVYDPLGQRISCTGSSQELDRTHAEIETQLQSAKDSALKIDLDNSDRLSLLSLEDAAGMRVGWVGLLSKQVPAGPADSLLEEVRNTLQYDYRVAYDTHISTSELTQRYEELNFLYRLTSTIQDLKSQDEMYQSLIRICLDHLTLNAAILVLPIRDGGVFVADDGESRLDTAFLSDILISELLPGMRASRASIVVNTPRERASYTKLAGGNIKLIASPIFKDNQVVGLLAVGGMDPLPDFSSSDRKLVETMAHHVSSVVNIHALSENARRLSKVVEQTPDIVIVTDQAGVIEYVNPAFEAITGYSWKEAVGAKPSILKSGEHGQEFYQELWKRILCGDDFRHVLINKKKNGDIFYTQQSIVPLKDSRGNILNFVSTAKDITDQVRSEEEARMALREKLEAEALNRAKSQFFSSMTHELRTPLNAIIGFGDLLMEDIQSAGHSEYVKDLQVMIKAGHHLLSLINNVLDMSKIEAGKMEVYAEPFSILELVEEVTQTVEPLTRKNGNVLLVDCAPEIGDMRSDKTKIKQILFNLVSNASKFTKQGKITLQVQCAADNPNNVVFHVIDTGIGMTKEQLSRMFQAFSQADASISKDYGGTGLGLMISKRFAEMLAGSIAVDSESGKGTTFTVILPRSLESEKIEKF